MMVFSRSGAVRRGSPRYTSNVVRYVKTICPPAAFS
jgi:hypothetical protein